MGERRLLKLGWGGMYRWATANYWFLSDKMRTLAERIRLWLTLARTMGTDPAFLALGIAEGTLLFKLTFMFHMPLELWLTVQIFKQQKHYLQNGNAATDLAH